MNKKQMKQIEKKKLAGKFKTDRIHNYIKQKQLKHHKLKISDIRIIKSLNYVLPTGMHFKYRNTNRLKLKVKNYIQC